MRFSLDTASKANMLGVAISGAQALSQIALSPWKTIAGVVVGAVVSLLPNLGLGYYYDGKKTFDKESASFAMLHIITSSVFGVLGPAEARFALLNKVGDLAKKYLGRGFALHVCGPFFNGFNLGFTGLNLVIIRIAKAAV